MECNRAHSQPLSHRGGKKRRLQGELEHSEGSPTSAVPEAVFGTTGSSAPEDMTGGDLWGALRQ